MKQSTSISRRISGCIEGIGKRDYEYALVNLFPALDKTAKKRLPKSKVGERIRGFLSNEEAIISALATQNVFKNIQIDGYSFPQVIYKFGRTSISHEGELDPRLSFNDEGRFQIGATWDLPSSYVSAMCIAVVIAPENQNEWSMQNFQVQILNETYELNALWGNRRSIVCKLESTFGQVGLFD